MLVIVEQTTGFSFKAPGLDYSWKSQVEKKPHSLPHTYYSLSNALGVPHVIPKHINRNLLIFSLGGKIWGFSLD